MPILLQTTDMTENKSNDDLRKGEKTIFDTWNDVRRGVENDFTVRFVKTMCKEVLLNWYPEYKNRNRQGIFDRIKNTTKIIRSRKRSNIPKLEEEKEKLIEFWESLEDEGDNKIMREF